MVGRQTLNGIYFFKSPSLALSCDTEILSQITLAKSQFIVAEDIPA
jgi:hypothetical protein